MQEDNACKAKFILERITQLLESEVDARRTNMNHLHLDAVKGQARDEAHQMIQHLREYLEELIVLWDDRPNQDNETAPHFSGGSSAFPTADVNSLPDIMYSSLSDSDDSRSRQSSPQTTNVFLEYFLRPHGSCGRETASKSVE